MSAGVAVSQLPWMWLVSRASGLMLLVLFSTVFVLGISTRLGTRLRTMPRFAVAELHRTLALFSVALLTLHVATAVLDPYVSIGWWAAVLPFTAHYRTLALGLGTLAVDLGAAVLITSLVRQTARASMVADGALAGVRIVAAGLHALAQRRQRYEHLVGRGSRVGLGQRRCPGRGRSDPLHPAVPEGNDPALEFSVSAGDCRPSGGSIMSSTQLLLDHTVSNQAATSTPRLLPEPWAATTLATHLERHGALVHHPSSDTVARSDFGRNRTCRTCRSWWRRVPDRSQASSPVGSSAAGRSSSPMERRASRPA